MVYFPSQTKSHELLKQICYCFIYYEWSTTHKSKKWQVPSTPTLLRWLLRCLLNALVHLDFTSKHSDTHLSCLYHGHKQTHSVQIDWKSKKQADWLNNSWSTSSQRDLDLCYHLLCTGVLMINEKSSLGQGGLSRDVNKTTTDSMQNSLAIEPINVAPYNNIHSLKVPLFSSGRHLSFDFQMQPASSSHHVEQSSACCQLWLRSAGKQYYYK